MSRRSNRTHNPAGFVRVTHVRCPDCEDRGALRSDGGAKRVSGGQLRPPSQDVGITTAAAGCKTCKGKGSLEVPADNDPRRREKLEALLAADVSVRHVEIDPYHVRTGWQVRPLAE